MMQVVEELNNLRLDLLDEAWVQGIYYSEFLEFGEFPPEYESVLENMNVRRVFKDIMKSADSWLNAELSDEEKSWAGLSNHVPQQKLLAILAYYIDYGTKNVLTKEYRNNALLASRVYYKFLSISGYKVYHIYHSQLFAHSLACLNFPKAMCDNDKNFYNTKELTREVNSLIREMKYFVSDLRAIIESLQLNPSDMNFEDIVSNLVDITGGAIVNRLDVDKIELVDISRIIYEIINFLICDSEGQPDASAIKLLFKCILPKLLAASSDSRNATNLVRASYVTYSGLLLSKYGKAALPGYTVLLQHLCYSQNGLERADVRTARVTLVVGMMSLLPQKSYKKLVKWLLKLSTTERVTHRHIALEILSKLLCNDSEEVKRSPNKKNSNQQCGDRMQSNPTNNQCDNDPQSGDQTQSNQCYNVQPLNLSDDREQQNTKSDNQVPKDQSKNQTPQELQNDQSGNKEALNNQSSNQEPQNDQTSTSQSKDVSDNQLPHNDQPSITQSENQNTVANAIEPPGDIQTSIDIDLPIGDHLLNDLHTDDLFRSLNRLSVDIAADELFLSELISDCMPLSNIQNQTSDYPNSTSDQQNHVKQAKGEQAINNDQNLIENQESVSNESQKQIKSNVVMAMATDDESSQDSQLISLPENAEELTEEEVVDLLKQRVHTVPHDQILLAVYERVNDSASTLRCRALSVLTECLESDHQPMKDAIKLINGDGPVSRLMALAARSLCDERAAVRRAAISLVHRSLAITDEPPQPNDLGILVGLCRDASIVVRSAAITALGELATQRPCNATLDAYLTGPIHQLSDPETKVQDQVMNQIQDLLILRLRKYGVAEDQLPWLFLAAVTRHNMRRHLQKACTLLAKATSCMSHRIVDIVSTHLGSEGDERDLQCLVLLTSAARHVDCNDIAFVLNYYYRLASNETDRDVRLMPLTLELLTAWSRWGLPTERESLREHLVQRLAAAHDDGCRLACASLAAHLDPENLHWATELMQISEQRAINSSCVEEWVRAADVSLVATVPPSPRLLRLFLTALSDPPIEWSAMCLGACVAGCGRLCIRSRDSAAAAAPVFAHLLQADTVPLAARVNSLLALTDICTRYTCIVEPLLGCVCGCLAVNVAGELRRAAARALTRLLLAGYLRLRTPLYYKYCALLADEDHDVREPAEYYVTCCLTTDAIYHHFVDCILHYNTDEENISFDARQLIYDVMLQRLSIVQKLNVQCRIAREVLVHAADVTDEGDGELPPALNSALLDSITLLCGPRMKLPKKPQRDGGDADIDDLQERITTNIVSHKMKSTVAEVLVPAVLRLYSRVSGRGGQVAVYLVRIANDLLADYRQEIEELFENDEELMQKVLQFQETIGVDPSFGNARNLVTASTTHEPETPKAPRRRAQRNARSPPRKRALRI